MTVFIIRRLLQSALVVAIMTLLVFFGVMVIGNPADILISERCTGQCYRDAVAHLGLDRPVWEQYVLFIGNALQGELGNSFAFGIPALELIVRRLPATLELAFVATCVAVLLGIPLGLWAGLKPKAVSSQTIMSGSIIAFSMPSFWVGIMLIVVFAVELGWLPASGRGPTVEVLGLHVSILTLDGLRYVALPATNLALGQLALVIRLARAGTREVLYMDYIKFANAKGIERPRIVFVHVLKNIMIPIVTVLGLNLGGVIAFAVVTETVFAWPG
ncbi:MAG: ABC transporter permease, partial [Alphaproteobacteria bacterium]|nr:ABC transporter permease [Alphaproteobacteria bacterium]